LDQNCTDFNIKIQFEFIKYESKVSGKKKENISLCSAISAQSSATSPAARGPAAWRSLPRAQAATWAWAAALAQLISAARADRTVGLQYRWIKTSERCRSLNPSPHSFSFSSPHSSPSVSHRATQADGESVEPWRLRRPPRRRARSPAGERAAVERPGRGAPVAGSRRAEPPAGLSFPRAPA